MGDTPRARPAIGPGDEPVPGFRLIECRGECDEGEVWLARGPDGSEVQLTISRLDGLGTPGRPLARGAEAPSGRRPSAVGIAIAAIALIGAFAVSRIATPVPPPAASDVRATVTPRADTTPGVTPPAPPPISPSPSDPPHRWSAHPSPDVGPEEPPLAAPIKAAFAPATPTEAEIAEARRQADLALAEKAQALRELEEVRRERRAEQMAREIAVARRRAVEVLTPILRRGVASLERMSKESRIRAAARPRTATITVTLPTGSAELVVRGPVGRGRPDEWYGPRRVIHTPPLEGGHEYLVGAFWKDAYGVPKTRSCPLRVEPGRAYEVDLRPADPSSKEVPAEP